MQCLAKKPEDRPGSARELGRLVSACDVPAWTEEDAAEWWETHLPPTSSLRSFAREDGPSPRVVRKA
jgi:hypothetical protein